MRKIRIFEHISLDGVIELGEGYTHGEWTTPYRSPEGRAAVTEAHGTGFDLLLGRRTYDIWANYWPKAGRNPIADPLNAATKYVATHRPDSLQWGPAKDLGKDVVEGVRRLKSKDGPDLIVWGSSTVTSVLIAEGLADEMVLFVYPIMLGPGKRLFSHPSGSSEFALVSTKAISPAVLMNTYRYVGPLRMPEPQS